MDFEIEQTIDGKNIYLLDTMQRCVGVQHQRNGNGNISQRMISDVSAHRTLEKPWKKRTVIFSNPQFFFVTRTPVQK